MNILLLGSGGREHAIAWKISQSPRCSKLYVAPGNAGTASCATNVLLSATDFAGIRDFSIEKNIELLIVGPEEPLVNGIRDFFLEDEQLKKIPVIGPGRMGAKLEGSKDFAKDFMSRHGIPTAAYRSFTKFQLKEAFQFLETLKAPYVLKADGLAAGKGVIITADIEEAKAELDAMLNHEKFGSASQKVVIEEFLNGIELSYFVLTDGISYKILPEAKDYKRIGDGDTGLNTGGMGSVSPVPFANDEFRKKVEDRVVKPTIEGLKKDRIDYTGFVFIGLMNVNGDPFVIEYNVRLGDPETEVVIPRIQSDLLELFISLANGKLSSFKLEINPHTAMTVMLVSGGYPGNYSKGEKIKGLELLKKELVFHAGTKLNTDSSVETNGGRVIAFTSFGNSISEARENVYGKIKNISFEKMYYRKDIGMDLIK